MYPYLAIRVKGKKYDVHRVIAGATNLGPNYVVHHIDGNKHNNTPENLQILTRKEHLLLHGFGTKINSRPRFVVDNDGFAVCRVCGKRKYKEEFEKNKTWPMGITSLCKQCRSIKSKARRQHAQDT